MARYVTSIRTSKSPTEAFEFMADLRNFEQWDPGVERATQVTGDGGGPGAGFDVVVQAPGKGLSLRYRTIEYSSPEHVVVKASSRMFTSLDRIDVRAEGDGCVVTYDAELSLNGPLAVFDLALRPVFARIGGRANDGLLRALDGEQA